MPRPNPIPITRHVPVPTQGCGARRSYPVPDMRVGDSFLVADMKPAKIRNVYNAVLQCVKRFQARLKVHDDPSREFIVRIVKENDKPGVRCWRTK